MRETVTILGDGAMATVCSMLLTQGGHRVTMWGAFEESIERLIQNRENQRLLPGARIPPNVRLTANDRDCFDGATLILSAIPTQYIRSVWRRLLPFAPTNLPIVSVAKGIENNTMLRPTQVIAEVVNEGTKGEGRHGSTALTAGEGTKGEEKPEARSRKPEEIRHSGDSVGSALADVSDQSSVLSPQSSIQHSAFSTQHSSLNPEPRTPNPTPQHSAFSIQHSPHLAALSGPNIAAELAKYLPATAVVAAEDEELARLIQRVFSTEWFRVYTNPDIIGVELAGAAKNVVAIAAGILDGLAAGNNAKAALVTRGLVEITRLGMAMGARADTFTGLAGLGDLITTCVSPEGRNRSVGERIGKGQKLPDILASMDSVAEGVPTTRSVMQLARRHNVEMPITEAVHSVLFEDKDVLHALTELMTRDPKPETGGFQPL